MKSTFWFGLLGLLAFAGIANANVEEPDAVKIALSTLTGITYKEVLPAEDSSIPTGYRRFEIKIDQPVDHFSAKSGRFTQRLALLHKDFSEPMVLQTSGYSIFGVRLSALAKNFGSNQLQIEHRFFADSAPAIFDWSKLNITQSANDFHRITQEFKKIYQKKWVNTGASKGGMTSVYHRRFFPNDLDGTVSDVAPLSFSPDDARYIDFVNQAGGAKFAECRAKLRALQVAMLERREELLPLLTGSYVLMGGKSVVYEHTVIELPFAFWQYQNPENTLVGCAKVPAPTAPAAVLVGYLNAVSPLGTDASLLGFMPYYYQAATELGSPASELAFLDAYRLHDYNICQYIPSSLSCVHTDASMRDVERWVKEEAKGILFLYGEFDPWSAGEFPSGIAANNVHKFFIPGGNHGSNLFALPTAEKAKALEPLRVWMGKRELPTRNQMSGETLDELELKMRQKLGLR